MVTITYINGILPALTVTGRIVLAEKLNLLKIIFTFIILDIVLGTFIL